MIEITCTSAHVALKGQKAKMLKNATTFKKIEVKTNVSVAPKVKEETDRNTTKGIGKEGTFVTKVKDCDRIRFPKNLFFDVNLIFNFHEID